LQKDGAGTNLSKRRNSGSRETAEALALEGLTFLAADSERLERFVALTGLSLDNLRATSAAPDFLAGVLDYIAGDEPLLLAFAANCQIDPAEIMRAWTLLGGLPEAG
jgi:Protein of unknown function (DUF3572)